MSPVRTDDIIPILRSRMTAISGWLGLRLLTALILLPLAGRAQGAVEQKAQVTIKRTPSQEFRDFLAQPPPIKKILFIESGNHHSISIPEHPTIYLNRDTYYEGAMQAAGYYLQTRSNGIPNANMKVNGEIEWSYKGPGKETIAGATDRFAWSLVDGRDHLNIYPKMAADGRSEFNENWMKVERRLAAIRRLGLTQIADGVLAWGDPDHFSGTSPLNGPFSGTVSGYSNGLVSAITYSVGVTPKKQAFEIRYAYLPGRPFPPFQIVSRRTDQKGSVPLTNTIEELVVGESLPEATEGYKPSSFLSEKSPPPRMMIWSNNVRTMLAPNGRFQTVDETPPDYSGMISGEGHNSYVAILVLVIISAAFLSLYLARRGTFIQRQN